MSLEHSEACVKNGLPVILMGRVVDQFGVDCVIADNPNGARMAAELLLRTGCTNLAYLGRGGATYSDRERRDGFLATVAAAGVSASCHAVFGGIDDKVLFAAATTLLSGANRPDAVFCGNDSLAFAVIEAARSLGISIPADLSIVGFNNVPQAGWRSFNLTTIDLPVTACISMAMQLLSRRPGGEEYAPEVCRIPVELVVRGTTRQRPVGGRV
jgi:DNA-binding LacI/PurR family transcriptional regulator